MNHGGYVVQSDRGSAWGPFSSLRMIWTRHDNKQLYGAFERPPFPIKVDQPTLKDVMLEARISDFIMLGCIYGAGIGWGYLASRPMVMLTQRLIVFHGVSHIALVTALGMTFG